MTTTLRDKKVPTIKHTIIAAFAKVYPPKSFDPISRTFNGKYLGIEKRESLSFDRSHLINETFNYISHPITMITSFFGLPNQIPNGGVQSWSNIGKNLIGWQDGKDTPRTLFNIVKAPAALIVNLTMAVFKTGLNVIKLVTEFLPRLGADLCAYVKKNNDSKLAYGVATALEVFFNSWSFVGQAITSPVDGLRNAHKLGRKIAGDGIAGKILSGTLVVLSLSITATALTAAIIFAAPLVAKAAIAKFPALVHAALPIIKIVAAAFAVFSHAVIAPVAAFTAKALAAVGLTASLTAVSQAVTGTIIAVSGTVASIFDRRLNRFWDGSADAKNGNIFTRKKAKKRAKPANLRSFDNKASSALSIAKKIKRSPEMTSVSPTKRTTAKPGEIKIIEIGPRMTTWQFLKDFTGFGPTSSDVHSVDSEDREESRKSSGQSFH